MIIQLRPYQKHVVRLVSQAYNEDKHQGVMLQMPTGAGKSKTSAYIVQKYTSTCRQVLWLVHRDSLLQQAAILFAENGIHHRMICSAQSERAAKIEQFREFGKSFVSDNSNVVVCSVQTLIRRLDSVPWLNPSQIVADEAHLSVNKTFSTIINRFQESRLLGLTATPDRSDTLSFDRKDGGLYDIMIEGPSVAELIEWGNLARYEYIHPPSGFNAKIKHKIKGGDYDGRSLQSEIEENANVIYGNAVRLYRENAHELPAIVFCPTVAIAQETARQFCEGGYKFVCLDGETEQSIQRKALKDLASGAIHGVTSCELLIEGVDVPLATVAIMMRRTKSLRIYLQAIGRVLRPHEDKEKAIILDLVGLIHEHGWPDDEREWSLTGKSKRKQKADGEEEEIKTKTCPNCYCVHRPYPQCPKCGHEYVAAQRGEIEYRDGEMVKKTSEDLDKQRIEKIAQRKQRLSQEHQCESLQDLIELGQNRNYKFPRQWATRRWSFILKARAGASQHAEQ